MPTLAGQEPYNERIEVRATKAHKEVIKMIMKARPEYPTASSVVIAALYQMARSEGIPV